MAVAYSNANSAKLKFVIFNQLNISRTRWYSHSDRWKMSTPNMQPDQLYARNLKIGWKKRRICNLNERAEWTVWRLALKHQLVVWWFIIHGIPAFRDKKEQTTFYKKKLPNDGLTFKYYEHDRVCGFMHIKYAKFIFLLRKKTTLIKDSWISVWLKCIIILWLKGFQYFVLLPPNRSECWS